ncbi:BNR repeat-containing glycosyl hydrolase [Paraburkholderia atlantica]|uniref:BNR repeat-containing glycosyl hydrolase n=1 Tax=Paraburkholderia atlantica TaxID=2654982 RepID=D5W8A6_PARAM|nr:YCF48-related protein [Paraburkholderia atlantica]ADG15651.1 BNR repeat-containing glycosyl hydrolase [Paraburkholderia atlantica]
MQKTKSLKLSCAAALALLAALTGTHDALAGGASDNNIALTAAKHRDGAERSMMLGATLAGSRIVAVGEHGVILLSDDNGAHFRQAHEVPANATLTSVAFTDARHGWAAGHWGVVLHTDDGGENWRVQRSDTGVDQPLFSIAFRDGRHGWAVGLWSLLVTTDDGGATWNTRQVDQGAGAGTGKSGLNFFSVFAGPDKDVYIAAEQGTVFRSNDDGASWQALHTGYKGTLWSGVVAPDRTVYVGGLRGNLFASGDAGATWQAVPSGANDSITDLVANEHGVAAVALDGHVTVKQPDARDFVAKQLQGRDALTALVLNSDGSPVLFSKHGVIAR